MRFFNDVKAYKEYILYGIKSGLKAEVAGSYLGWVWWVLEPFCFMIIYATVFGMIFETTEQYYALFIFIGNAMWTFFSKSVACSVSLVKTNETIVSKMYLPKYILMMVELGINAVKLLINFILVVVMLILFKVPMSVNVLYSIPIFIIFMIVTFAICVVFMHGGVFIEDLSYVVSIVLNMMMFFTGIFYSVEDRLGHPIGTILGNANPVAFLMTSMRKAVMYATQPNLRGLVIWGILGCLMLYWSIKLVYKNENNYVKVI